MNTVEARLLPIRLLDRTGSLFEFTIKKLEVGVKQKKITCDRLLEGGFKSAKSRRWAFAR